MGVSFKKLQILFHSLAIALGSTLEVGVGPAVEGLILFEKSVASWESDITEWLESSPIALTGVSELKKNEK